MAVENLSVLPSVVGIMNGGHRTNDLSGILKKKKKTPSEMKRLRVCFHLSYGIRLLFAVNILK